MALQLLTTENEFRSAVRTASKKKRLDTHVHVMPICMGEQFAKFGLKAGASYHYLVGEASRKRRLSSYAQKAYLARSDAAVATDNLDAILGGGAAAVSTAVTGWYAMAGSLGIDTHQPHDEILRAWEAQYGDMLRNDPRQYQEMIFDKSCVSGVVSTQSIFDPAEANLYLTDSVLDDWDPKFEAAIRFDEALRKPAVFERAAKLTHFSDACGDFSSSSTQEAVMALVSHHIDRFRRKTKVRYISASLAPGDRFYDDDGKPSQSRFAVYMREVVIPLAKRHGLPVFLMPYVTRGVNPSAGASGDCVSTGDTDDLIKFVSDNPDVAFILTALHPSMDYNLCFLTRCCTNVTVIGFWWGNLNSVEVRSQIQRRFEFIGTNWYGLNSDARILDQILYKWNDYWADLEHVLATIILPASVRKGAPVTEESVVRAIDEIQDSESLFWTPAH